MESGRFSISFVEKFHNFRISALPMPLPEAELLTLHNIYNANRQVGPEYTSISLVASRQHVSVPTVSRCLKKLEDKGLIEKNGRADDRRGTYVSLTPRGEEVYLKACSILNDFVNHSLSRIDPDKLEQFFCTFDEIYEALRKDYDALATVSGPEENAEENPDEHAGENC